MSSLSLTISKYNKQHNLFQTSVIIKLELVICLQCTLKPHENTDRVCWAQRSACTLDF